MTDGNVKKVAESFTVYDLFEEGSERRDIISESGQESRLEKYIFQKMEDGTMRICLQEGWFAGSHYDGCGNDFELPEEWFSSDFDSFLDRFCEKYPAEKFSYTRGELKTTPGLKEFLGFKDEKDNEELFMRDGPGMEYDPDNPFLKAAQQATSFMTMEKFMNNVAMYKDTDKPAGRLIKDKICPNCGAEVSGTSKFCQKCGEKLI